MEDLTFDPVKEYCTTMAEKYISEHKHFQDGPQKGKCFVFRNEDMFYHVQFKFSTYFGEKTTIDYKIRKTFSEKLKKNENLFCELEYLNRKYDIEDTKKQLELILQYLQCYNTYWNTDFLHYTLLVTEDTPLYCLGYLLGAIYCGKQVRLITTMKTAPVCFLFYQVCLDAEIDVPLLHINEEDISEFAKTEENLFHGLYLSDSKGCTLVLTEYADIQSAVDVFLYSSRTAPWKIDHILVQESKIEAVKATFSSQGKGRRVEDRPRQYEAAFETRRGTVAFTLGTTLANADDVRVSSYRTVKELVSLLQKPLQFLSLWCGNIDQAHEIATAVPVPYIWIDGYADFDGPSEISLSLYTAPLYYRTLDVELHTQLMKLKNKWSKLTSEHRKTIVLNAMEKFELKDDLLEVYNSIGNFKPKDIALMEKKKLTVVIDCPEKEVVFFRSDVNLLPALELVIKGYCVYISGLRETTEDLILEMNKDMVPIISSRKVEFSWSRDLESDTQVEIKAHHGNKKVIQTNFGTFAI